VLLGGPPEERPGVGVVLDVSPTLAVRVKRIVEVADVARAPFFMLPPGLGEALALIARGAVFHKEQLFLELVSDALPHRPAAPGDSLGRAIFLLDQPPERGLVFESHGMLFGVPLNVVSQVVGRSNAFCPLPVAKGPVLGLFPHAQVLWPIYDVTGLLGGRATPEELFVLTELAGQSVGFSASRVHGVHQGFQVTAERGEYGARDLSRPALFLDLQRMFS
jgi:hypothetical protein